MSSLLIKNASQIVTPKPGELRGEAIKQLTEYSDTSIFIQDDIIQTIAPVDELLPLITSDCQIIDADGKAVLPGFVDSHTHLVFGGHRENEFAQRCSGLSYEEIANQGGGILSTVNATRRMSQEELVKRGLMYLQKAVRHGTTSIEIKSGYGLDRDTELKILRVIDKLKEIQPVEITSTFLGAHAIPPDKSKSDYIQEIMEMMPEAALMADFCDLFCELGYFSVQESLDIFCEAKKIGLIPRMHTNQFNNIGGIQGAIEMGAVAVEHLETLDDTDIAMLAGTDICATMLPGVSLFLKIPYAPGRKILNTGCIPVLATDFNPGSCMTLNMPLILNLACTQMGFSMPEAVSAATQNGAYALGRDNVGCIAPGWQADLMVLESNNYQNLIYFYGEPQVEQVIKKGKVIFDRNLSWQIHGLE